jgi:hypothetical protein
MVKVKESIAREVCARFYLPVEIYKRTRKDITPRQFLETVLENEEYLVGIDFLAHALPAREAIWWGCLCLQHVVGEKLTAADKGACRAAVQWVTQPTEESRVRAQAEADAVGIASPAGALAAAAAQTGGSVAPHGFPPVPPQPFAPAKMVGMSIKVSATKAEPVKMVQTQKLFIGLGIEIAEGLYL